MAKYDHGDLSRWMVSSVEEFGSIPFEPVRGMSRNATFSAIASEPVRLWLEITDDATGDLSRFFLAAVGPQLTDVRFNVATDCYLVADGPASAQIQLRFDNDNVVRVYDPSESLTEFDPRALGGDTQTEMERMLQMSRLNDQARLAQMERSFERQIRMVQTELAAAKAAATKGEAHGLVTEKVADSREEAVSPSSE